MTNNDWKYVIKRVITYIVIALIMLLFNFARASALTTASYSNNGNTLQLSISQGTDYKSTFLYPAGNQGTLFHNYGEGYILFTFQTSSYNTPTTSQLSEVNIGTSDNSPFNCDIGTTQGYLDSNKQIMVFTATCPVNLTNRALRSLTFIRGGGSGQLDIAVGSMISFVSKDSNTSSSTIIADLTTIQQYQIDINNNISQFKNATHTDLQNLINALSQNHQDAVDINNNINNVNNNIQEMNDNITDETPPSQTEVSGNTSDWSNNNAESGVINQLLLMPITLLQSFVNGINSTCSTYTLGQLWGTNLDLPCIDLGNILGSLWTLIDVIMSGIFIFIFGKRCVRIFNDFTNLKGGQVDQLYGGDN